MMEQIYYRELHRYKYQLAEASSTILPSAIADLIDGCVYTEFISIDRYGCLHINPGYSWDGLSGPTWDTKKSKRASLIHDALYQLMRMGQISLDCKGPIDVLFYDMCIKDKIWKIRAWIFYQGVKHAAGFAIKPKGEEWPILTAP